VGFRKRKPGSIPSLIGGPGTGVEERVAGRRGPA
jgi:hypothetical protein